MRIHLDIIKKISMYGQTENYSSENEINSVLSNIQQC